MEIGVRDLRNRTARVIDAVRAGERVVLTVNGEPVADIVPHGRRARWLPVPSCESSCASGLPTPLCGARSHELAGNTLAEL